MTNHITFRQLESPNDPNPSANTGDSPLEKWYRSVRDKPIGEFSYNDLCKACRQQLYPEAVVPIAIETLRKDPLAGELYDGELLIAMKSVDRQYWLVHLSQAAEIATIAKSIMRQVDDESRTELEELIALLKNSKK
jgi:hypothetical protein